MTPTGFRWPLPRLRLAFLDPRCRAWYRNREIQSRLVDGPNGPQRLVPLDAVVERAARSPRLQRRAEREISLEAQVALLQHRLTQAELRLARLERDR